jgi:hypothetical protein
VFAGVESVPRRSRFWLKLKLVVRSNRLQIQELTMSLLRQRMLEDMQLRNFSAGTQRSYIHYVAEYASYYGISPDRLGLDDVRNYQLYLLEQRQLSPQSINCFVAAAKFLYTVTLEMPWSDQQFSRLKVPEAAPVVLSRSVDSIAISVTLQFFNQVRSCFRSRVKVRKVLLRTSTSGLPMGGKIQTVTFFLCTSMPQQRRYFLDSIERCSSSIAERRTPGKRVNDFPTRVHPRSGDNSCWFQ